MNYEKTARKFVMKLGKRLHVTIHPEVELQLIGEIVSLMKSAAHDASTSKIDVEEIWSQASEHDWGYGGA